MTYSSIALGKTGEDYAAVYLKEKGFTILARNYRTRRGEIDIIASPQRKRFWEPAPLVFFEVKTIRKRGGEAEILPEENIHRRKQLQMIRAAKLYLAEKKLSSEINWQIDILALEIDENGKCSALRHIEQAVGDIGAL